MNSPRLTVNFAKLYLTQLIKLCNTTLNLLTVNGRPEYIINSWTSGTERQLVNIIQGKYDY